LSKKVAQKAPHFSIIHMQQHMGSHCWWCLPPLAVPKCRCTFALLQAEDWMFAEYSAPNYLGDNAQGFSYR